MRVFAAIVSGILFSGMAIVLGVSAQEFEEYPPPGDVTTTILPEDVVVEEIPLEEMPADIPLGMEGEFVMDGGQNLVRDWQAPDITSQEDALVQVGKPLRRGVVRLGYVDEMSNGFQGTGTGFAVHEDGYIFTNAHVVEGFENQMQVQSMDGNVYTAQILAAADPFKVDIAILKVDEPMTDVKVLEFAKQAPERGDILFNVGNPAIFGDWVIKAGGYMGEQFNKLVLDMPGSQGDSGSPLFNTDGKIVGIIFGATNLDGRPQVGPEDDIVIWWGNFTKYFSSVGQADSKAAIEEFVSQHLDPTVMNAIFNN